MYDTGPQGCAEGRTLEGTRLDGDGGIDGRRACAVISGVARGKGDDIAVEDAETQRFAIRWRRKSRRLVVRSTVQLSG